MIRDPGTAENVVPAPVNVARQSFDVELLPMTLKRETELLDAVVDTTAPPVNSRWPRLRMRLSVSVWSARST